MAASQEHLLVVDDDRAIRTLLTEYLAQNEYRVTSVADGKEMRKAMSSHRINLVILDLMLPGEDGLTLCRDLRAHSNIPVLMLTAKNSDIDRIIGLEMGADDYLTKPFNPRELLARVKSILRRSNALPQNLEERATITGYRFDDWVLDLATRNIVATDGLVVPLSGAEFRLLRVFLEHPQSVLSRDQLLELIAGRETIPFDRSIDVLIGRLRKRLQDDGKEPSLIKTVRGEGYVLAIEVRPF